MKPQRTDGKPIQYYILCRNDERVEQWRARVPEIEGVEFHLRSGYASMYAFIADAIDHTRAATLVVAHDDVIVGRDFAARVQALVAELDDTFPNWGLAGNAGVAADGVGSHVYVKDPWCRPQRAHGPEPVACIDGNLMLINKLNVVRAGCDYPDYGGFHGYDLVLSFECLRAGLLVVADGRLGAVHLSGGNRGVYERYMRAAPFQDYFRSRFADRRIPSLLGTHPVMPGAGPAPEAPRPTLQQLVDRALVGAPGGRRQRLAIVRWPVQGLDMPPSGRSAPAPGASARLAGIDVQDIEVPAASELRALQGPAGVNLAVLGVLERLRSSHDYFWFIPPGSAACDAALPAVARALASRPGGLVVAGAALLHDGSAGSEDGTTTGISIEADFLRTVFSAGVFPLAALVFPAAPLRRAFEAGDVQAAFGDGALMAALTLGTPGVRTTFVREPIAEVGPAPTASDEAGRAYGTEADWAQVDRLGVLNVIAARSSPLIWALAADAALAPAPSAAMNRAQDIAHVLEAFKQVTSKPGKYLGRGLSLAFGYLVRGDLRGLIREARLFRPR